MMPARLSLRDEMEALRKEIEALRQSRTPPAEQVAAPPDEGKSGFERQIGELNQLVHAMLDEAEDTVAKHPVSTVAGALALGIVIGRLTAR
jgi:ElaB/YqjD/DUF883 family membrane-anchored ribosome-binding protein